MVKQSPKISIPGSAHLDENGHEIVSSIPLEPPLGYKKQPTMIENIRAMVRSENLRQEAESAGAETFQEADDFDVGDDVDPSTPYEEVFEPPIPADAPKVPIPPAAVPSSTVPAPTPPVPPADAPKS